MATNCSKITQTYQRVCMIHKDLVTMLTSPYVSLHSYELVMVCTLLYLTIGRAVFRSAGINTSSAEC